MKYPKTTVSLIAIAMLFGCATTPQVDARFGDATTGLRAQQLRDPAASLRNDQRPVDGMGGQAASNAVDQYNKSYTKPAPQMNILNMGVLGGMAE
jgi:hypothetical protein